jgi:hypothetical protein
MAAIAPSWLTPGAMAEAEKARRTGLMPRLTGFEAAEATWRRIALRSRMVGVAGEKKPEEETAEAVKRMADVGVKLRGDSDTIKVNIGLH